ncbi:hypothetical protein [Mucilaginibacter flavus]|uniref:hypothetical protein n=1 Tax=Mucilaginibacter flavus TaxID=931504 RepID=UPI0025B60259|nr:hypothetical protein [Mucilaginibacter flavus]MDN3581898.1 hypothetical protein [Mucilaginibacter flavus]
MPPIKTLLSTCFIILLFGACRKDNNTTTLQITVTNGRTGIVSAGAVIQLYKDSASVSNNKPTYQATTGADGVANINASFQPRCFILIENGSLKNFYNGYVPAGIFNTQADINNNPSQTPTPSIGDIRFRDTNGDGKIDTHDKVFAPSIGLDNNAKDVVDLKIY